MNKPKNNRYYVAIGWHLFPWVEDVDLSISFPTYEKAEKYKEKWQCDDNAIEIFLYLGNCWWHIEHDNDLEINTWTKVEAEE